MKAQGLVQDKNLGQVVTSKHGSGKPDGKYNHSSSGRGNTYASGSGRSEAGRAGGAGWHGGRGGK